MSEPGRPKTENNKIAVVTYVNIDALKKIDKFRGGKSKASFIRDIIASFFRQVEK